MDILNSLQKKRVSFDSDKISWKGPAGCSFSVNEACKVLNSRANPLFPSKGIWIPCIPTKEAFFAWEAAWEKVLTLDKLKRKGWHLPNRCYLCGRDEESIHHILLHCSMVSPLWDLFFSLIGFSWVFPKTIKDALISWKGSFVGKKRRKICIFWTVWKKRNGIAFRDGTVDVQKLKPSFVSNL